MMRQFLLATAFLLFTFTGFGQCPQSDITLRTQQEVDDFSINYPNCTELGFSLEIGTRAPSPTNITNLNGISQITKVGLEGSGLESALFIENTPLQDLSGLENLEYVGGRLWIQLTEIQNLSGLSNLEFVGGGITLQDNEMMINLEGIRPNLELRNGFYIFNNDNLESFEGLSIINQEDNETFRITIAFNPELNSLNGLENTRRGERIRLLNNNMLTDISQLSNMDISVSDAILEIVNNSNLSDCNILTVCQAINDPLVTSTIENNELGCNSIAEVNNQCKLSVQETDVYNSISISPNPVSEKLTISITENFSLIKVEIYSIGGQKLKETSAAQVDMSDLSAGIYFVSVVTERGTITKKIIKK